jgi:hypothetical protein
MRKFFRQRIQTIFLLLVCYFPASSFAQHDAVADAERKFARCAVDSGVRYAFLAFLHPNGVVFRNGDTLNGLTAWSAPRKNDYKLLWRPAYTGMASSGDLGFSSGPFEVRSPSGELLSAGQYNTIWIKDASDQWKVLADIGTRFSPNIYSTEPDAGFSFVSQSPARSAAGQSPEKDFLRVYDDQGNDAFDAVITAETWFSVEGQLPAMNGDDARKTISGLPHGIKYVPFYSGASGAGDLSFSYGQALNGDKKQSYLRIWTVRQGKWKLVLQVLV